MRTLLRAAMLIIGTLFLFGEARASHIYAADFYYTHLGNNLYRISMDVYGDCSATSYNLLFGSSPQVEVYDQNNGNALLRYMYLRLRNNVEVTPSCSALAGQSTCIQPSNPVPGVQRFTFDDTVTISHPSSGWRIRFQGDFTNNSLAGRTTSISNILNGTGGSIMVLEIELNNTLPGGNSSPQFSTMPTPFYCINIQQQYNQGSVDPNGDSLYYELAHPLQRTTGNTIITPVNYAGGYSATNPLATTPGSYSFDPLTGQLDFKPNIAQQALVVNKVTEYRNGVKVGTAVREMTFIVLSNCNNVPPAGGISGPVNGGAWGGGGSTVRTCQGGGTVSFHVKPVDPEGAAVLVSTAGLSALPGNPVVSVANNNTTAPDLLFSWDVSAVPPGLYTFFVNAKDDGCPQPSQQTQAFSVEVVPFPVMTATMLGATQCAHKAPVQYTLNYGIPPLSVTVRRGTTTVSSFPSVTGSTVIDSLPAGTYTAEINSSSTAGVPCSGSYTFTIVDSGAYTHPPRGDSAFYCLNDQPVALTATADPGASLHWFDAGGAPLPGAPTPSTATAGIFNWIVKQRFLVCESEGDTVPVYVTRVPTAGFDLPDPYCARDTATIAFTGSIGVGPIIDYEWNWAGANYAAGPMGGPYRLRWDTPGVKTVSLRVLENKCPSALVQQTIRVKPTPFARFAAQDLCAKDTLQLRYTATPLPGQTYDWKFEGANIAQSNAPGPFGLRWEEAGDRRLQLTVALEGCSESAEQEIRILPKPTAFIADLPKDPCLGDEIYLLATGGSSYSWSPAERIFTQPDGRLYTYAMVPTTYTVTASNQYGCSDSASWAIRSIQPCCNFTYPNAFSPNGDGHNDRFRVVMWGNPDRYDFSIYNRWGQRMFHSFDPKESWDGTFKGEPCDIGTYMYYLKARCMTGREETQSGDLVLIR